MGFSAAYGVRAKGKTVWSYAHGGGEPSLLGMSFADAAARLIKAQGVDALAGALDALRLVEADAEPTTEDRDRFAAYADWSVNGGRGYYCLLRGLQGDIERQLELGVMMAAGAYICDRAYLIDLDEGMFKAFDGFYPRRGGADENAGAVASPEGPVQPEGPLLFASSLKGLAGKRLRQRFGRSPDWL